MGDMAGWLARRQGQPVPQPPPQQQPQYPQVHYPPQPYQQQYYPPQPPPNYGQYPQQQQYPQQFAGQQPQPQYYPPQQQGPPLLPNGKLDVNAAKAMFGKDYEGVVAQMWKGGEATRTENQRCPKCDDGIMFSMHNTEGIINVNTGQTAYVAPYCATCGYRPGKHMQGDMANWASV